MLFPQIVLKRMGVMNITPNSFSDGGELSSPESILKRLEDFGPIDALDIGAESTAPMNEPITHYEEWRRLQSVLALFKNLNCTLSLDTYHPETIERMVQFWIDEKIKTDLIWNDVSGKFDEHVLKFLKRSEKFHYILCHNLAPIRELTTSHMEYLSASEKDEFLDEMASHFRKCIHPRVIFDPTFGFSKTYDQNWFLMDHFDEFQLKIPHLRWLIGFSRKSFLRRKYGIEKITTENRDDVDHFHLREFQKLRPKLKGEIWIRTHRPELILTD